MAETEALRYESKQICHHGDVWKECHDVPLLQEMGPGRTVDNGSSGAQIAICYLDEYGCCRDRPVPPRDESHNFPLEECPDESKRPPADKYKMDGNEKQEKHTDEKKSGVPVPLNDYSAWQGSFDRFSESYDGYLEDGDAVVSNEDEEPSSEKPVPEGGHKDDTPRNDKPMKEDKPAKSDEPGQDHKPVKDDNPA